MRPEDEVRIRHLLDAGSKALEYSSGKTRDDLSEDEVLRLALTKLVEIVGEAAKQVSTETRSEYPTVHGLPRRGCATAWFITTSTSISTFCGRRSPMTSLHCCPRSRPFRNLSCSSSTR